jgi:hypothetical protein
MKVSWFKILVSFFILILIGCSAVPTRTTPPRQEHVPQTEDVKPADKTKCSLFCEKIQSCAAKSGHPELSELLCSLARCETGNKCIYDIRSRRARYKGAFQFSGATWRTQCYPIFRRKGMNHCLNSKKVYDPCCSTACSAEIISRGGLFNWPGCTKKLKLR